MGEGPVGPGEPLWQPLGELPGLTSVAAQGVRTAREFLDLLRHAMLHRLLAGDLDRVIGTWEVTGGDLDRLFTEQGRRWRTQAFGTRHQSEVEHYCALVAEERVLVEKILILARELREEAGRPPPPRR